MLPCLDRFRVARLGFQLPPPVLWIPCRLGGHEQLYPLLVRLHDILCSQVAAVDQVLLHLAPSALFHLLAHRFTQPRRIGTLVTDFHPQNGTAFGIGGQLHVDSRAITAVGHLHPPRGRIRGAHPRLLGPDLIPALAFASPLGRFRLLLLQLRQLRNRLLQSLLPPIRRSLTRRLLTRRHSGRRCGRVQLLTQLRQLLTGLLQQVLQTLFPTKTTASRAHTHPH